MYKELPSVLTLLDKREEAVVVLQLFTEWKEWALGALGLTVLNKRPVD